MNKQQTSVEWLFTMLNNPNRDQEFANKLLQKAKEMEKEQIIKAFEDGKWDSVAFKATPNEQYYEQKYKGKK
jgi:hypothetical protein